MATQRRSQTSQQEPEFMTLVSDRALRFQRTFDAPRDAVYRAYTDPNLVPQWWGPRGVTTRVDTMDVRAGGRWRYVHSEPNGRESAFHGEYREVTPPSRLVSTFEFEGMPGRVVVDTATFQDVGGRTRLVVDSLFASQADRDRMLETGMEQGARETWDRLAELVENPRASR